MRYLALVTAIATLAAATAEAGPRRGSPIPRPDDVFVAEGKGCTWFKGEMSCPRFCYLEVDGRRYCHERSAQAFPQHLGYYWSQMYGGDPRRWRPRVEVDPDYRGRRWINAPRRDVD